VEVVEDSKRDCRNEGKPFNSRSAQKHDGLVGTDLKGLTNTSSGSLISRR